MIATKTIEDFARDNNLETGEAIYLILKYLVEDPRHITIGLKAALRGALEEDIVDAMETAEDDLAEIGKEKAML